MNFADSNVLVQHASLPAALADVEEIRLKNQVSQPKFLAARVAGAQIPVLIDFQDFHPGLISLQSDSNSAPDLWPYS